MTYGNKEITYSVQNDGYTLLLDNVPWIKQYEPFIPYRENTYELCAQAHINAITTQEVEMTQTLDQRQTTLEENVQLINSAIDSIMFDILPTMMVEEPMEGGGEE